MKLERAILLSFAFLAGCGGSTSGTNGTTSAGGAGGASAGSGGSSSSLGGTGGNAGPGTGGNAGPGTGGFATGGFGTGGSGIAGSSVGGAAGVGTGGSGVYQPCGGKSCGDTCSPCAPGDPSCAGPGVAMYCSDVGTCSPSFPVCGTGCKSDFECPQPGAPCQICVDGTYACPSAHCQNGQCSVDFPSCPAGPTCAGQACGSSCPCPSDAPCVESWCDGTGKCNSYFPVCEGPQCKQDTDCAVDDCYPCADGSFACSVGHCYNGVCSYETSSCPSPGCDPQNAYGTGVCDSLVGFAWNGKQCAAIGCKCEGTDCGSLSPTYDACVAAHSGCTASNACAGKQCGDYCSTCPPGEACPPVVQYCSATGYCTTESPQCGTGKCNTKADCPIDGGCQVCPDGSEICPQVDCIGNQCVYSSQTCGTDPDPCSGKACGDVCSTCPPGMVCPAIAEFCNIYGQCTSETPVCTFP
jgi:hypothetical protein